MSDVVISERNMALYRARESGDTFSALSRRFSISRKRVVQIYLRTKVVLARRGRNGNTVDTSSLSVRAVNALTNAGLGKATRWQLRVWLNGSFAGDLEKTRNIGRKTAQEIRAWASDEGALQAALKSYQDDGGSALLEVLAPGETLVSKPTKEAP